MTGEAWPEAESGITDNSGAEGLLGLDSHMVAVGNAAQSCVSIDV